MKSKLTPTIRASAVISLLCLLIAFVALRCRLRYTQLRTLNDDVHMHHVVANEVISAVNGEYDNERIKRKRQNRDPTDDDEHYHDDATRNRNHTDHAHYHDYAIFIVHYHKTGCLLSHQLKKLIGTIDIAVNRPGEKSKNYLKTQKFEGTGIDKETGERITFDHLGNWNNNAFPQRKHIEEESKAEGHTGCPPGPKPRKTEKNTLKNHSTTFELQQSTIYIQAAPDLYCSNTDLLSAMPSEGGVKILHFIRNPFDMALSNYFYHSQEPTPEDWVHIDDPCQNMYANDKSLSSHIVPILESWANDTALQTPTNVVTEVDMQNIVDMCQSLFQKQNGTFYEHLLGLDESDALRLATAQMTVASGQANKQSAGGDILRMANNIIRFQNLQKSSKANVQVLTMAMGDFINDTKNSTLKFLDFIFGDNEKITQEMRDKVAEERAEKYEKKLSNGNNHITQANADVAKRKEGLRQTLKTDARLGPTLNFVEILVNEALAVNRQHTYHIQ